MPDKRHHRRLRRVSPDRFEVILNEEVVGVVKKVFVPGLNGKPGQWEFRGFWAFTTPTRTKEEPVVCTAFTYDRNRAEDPRPAAYQLVRDIERRQLPLTDVRPHIK